MRASAPSTFTAARPITHITPRNRKPTPCRAPAAASGRAISISDRLAAHQPLGRIVRRRARIDEPLPLVQPASRVVDGLDRQHRGAVPGSSEAHATTCRTASSPTPRPRAAGAIHSQINSISPSALGARALTMPTGSPSSTSTRFRATSASRARHRASVSAAPLHSASVEPNAPGASRSAARRSSRQSRQSSAVTTTTSTTPSDFQLVKDLAAAAVPVVEGLPGRRPGCEVAL